jgi:1,4-alpha-glucan branching enzyme
MQPLYIPQPEPINTSVGSPMTFAAVANQSSTLKLYLNGTVIQTASNATSISATLILSQSGNNIAIAEATVGTTIKRDTIQFFISPAITIAPLPAGVRDGINYEADNTKAILVLYAPLKNRVSVIGDLPGSNWIEQPQYVMNKTPDGNYWWITLTGLTPGTEYSFQYLVNASLKIGDPYSEKILDPCCDAQISSATYPALKPYPNGQTTGIVSILQTVSPAYNWQVNNFARPDKRKLVVYELLLRDFLLAHDWKTLRDTLNYLQNLGVNTIEIMPFNEFEFNSGWGYNPDFYFAPDKYYGPKNSLKEFIDSCHKRGIAVVMDIALNHATGQCPLAALYWNSSTNQPAANNPWFNVTATHPFNVFNDFNHESLATKYFFSRVVEHWLQNYKLDGFRFDLSKGYTQTNTCTTGGCNTGAEVAAWSAYDQSRINIWKRYYDTLQLKSPGAYVILEHFADNNEEITLSNYGMLLWGNLAYNYQQAAMGYNTDWDFSWGIYTVRNWTTPNLITYMESHDEERLMYKNLQYGNNSGGYNIKDLNTALSRIELNGAFLFTIPGPKMLWEFGEMGYDYSINYCPSNGSINDSCRLSPKPIRWDYLQNIMRLRVHDIFAALMKLRSHPLYKDVFLTNQVERDLTGAFKWLKVLTDTSRILVVGNFGVTSQTGAVTFPSPGTWYDYLNGTTMNATGGAQSMTLQPGEYHVYLNRPVTNVVTTAVPALTAAANNKMLVNVYPNPFNQKAVIDISIPVSGHVQIDLINQQGQKLMNVYSGFLTRGDHRVDFEQNLFPTGVYILKISSKTSTAAIKLVRE